MLICFQIIENLKADPSCARTLTSTILQQVAKNMQSALDTYTNYKDSKTSNVNTQPVTGIVLSFSKFVSKKS